MFKTIHDCRVELVAHTTGTVQEGEVMGDIIHYTEDMDFMPCSAARASFGKEDKTGEDVAKDVKLMNYLAEHRHMTPFEYQHATFLIEVPLFIRSQIHRHRAFSFNEISRRYTSEDIEFWIPDDWRKQAKSNKQASEGVVDYRELPDIQNGYTEFHEEAVRLYEELMKRGVAREQARSVLPQSLLTRFYMGGNLRNWAHFIELRRDPHAQVEVQVVANRVADELKKLWPTSCAALGI